MNAIFGSQKEFDDHRLVSYAYDPKSNLKSFIAIHRGTLTVPAFGATRLYAYSSENEALRDALKLSRLMSYKAALAGLRCGGAKGVIIANTNNPKSRANILKAYSDRVNYFGGRFITGADVGIDDNDLKLMHKASPYMVGLKSDPVRYTAQGIVCSIQVCLAEVFDSSSIAGRTFAIQGVGKVGTALLGLLYKEAGKIYIADIDPDRLKAVKKMFPKASVVPPADIHKQRVDVFCPCALSNSVSVPSIGKMRCKIIAGGANNQLENNYVGALLYKLGILYAPDYVVNAGGLISVVDEYEHKSSDPKRIGKRVTGIKVTLRKVLKRSFLQKRATNAIADEMAEKIFNNHL